MGYSVDDLIDALNTLTDSLNEKVRVENEEYTEEWAAKNATEISLNNRIDT